jgi:hypothetical protein
MMNHMVFIWYSRYWYFFVQTWSNFTKFEFEKILYALYFGIERVQTYSSKKLCELKFYTFFDHPNDQLLPRAVMWIWMMKYISEFQQHKLVRHQVELTSFYYPFYNFGMYTFFLNVYPLGHIFPWKEKYM